MNIQQENNDSRRIMTSTRRKKRNNNGEATEPLLGQVEERPLSAVLNFPESTRVLEDKPLGDVEMDQIIRDNYRRSNRGFLPKLLGCLGCFCVPFCNQMQVEEGYMGLRYTFAGDAVILPPGRYARYPFERWGGEPVRVSQKVVTMGPRQIITVNDGEVAESYRDGKLVMLRPGRHLLTSATHTYVAHHDINKEVIKMKGLHIVNVRPGFVGVCYEYDANNVGQLKILPPGRYHLRPPMQTLDDDTPLLSIAQQTLPIPSVVRNRQNSPQGDFGHDAMVTVEGEFLQVKTTDNIIINVRAVLSYHIADPAVAVLKIDQLQKFIVDMSTVTLSQILRRFSYRDISPPPDSTSGVLEKPNVEVPKTIHERIHDEFLQDLTSMMDNFGVKIDDLKLRDIAIQDRDINDAIKSLAKNMAKKDAERRTAELEAQVVQTKARARKKTMVLEAEGQQESQVIVAQARQKTSIIEAEAVKQATIMRAEAEKQSAILKAEGEAMATKIIAEANLERYRAEGEGARALDTDIARSLAVLKEQKDIYKSTKNPVFFPQPEMGTTRVWLSANGKPSKGLFTSGAASGTNGGSEKDALLVGMLQDKLGDN